MDAPPLEEQAEGSVNMGKVILFAVGFALVVLGIALVLRNWDAAVIVFKGVMPVAIAVAGLVVMFAASIRP